MPVVDASVIVASLHRDEPGYAASRQWLGKCASNGVVLVAPAIAAPEVAFALSRGGDETLARKALETLLHSRLIELHDVGPRLAHVSGEIAAEHGLRGCDAVYVGLAIMTDGQLVTLDKAQLALTGAEVDVCEPNGQG